MAEQKQNTLAMASPQNSETVEIWCGLRAQDLDGEPDLIVLPEAVAWAEIAAASSRAPAAIVAGAVPRGGRMRGVIRHEGRNRINYWKVGDDRVTSRGSPPPKATPVYVTPRLAVGLLICMDIDNLPLMLRVVEALHAADAPVKVLCIPAQMASFWLDGPEVPDPRWAGLHVALCGGDTVYPEARRRSFIADPTRRKVREQTGVEAIRLEAAGRACG